MNICILKESLTIGGTERSAANISQLLTKNHKVYLALYDAENPKYTYDGELIGFEAPPKKTLLGKVYNTFYRNRKLKRLLKEKRIDLLFTFTSIFNGQTMFSYPEMIKIISARDFGLMRDRTSLYHRALCNSDAMVCNSEYLKSFYLSRYPEHSDRVFAVYNYINTAEIQKQATEGTEEDYLRFLGSHRQNIVSVGRFCKEKGFIYLIEAFARAREKDNGIGLVMVGDGKLKQQYLEKIQQFGLEEHVYFTGFQKNPYKYMAKGDCFVLSSLCEGFPNVLAEAMSLGLPVIATNCLSGPAEILRKDCDYKAVTDTYQECDYGIMTPEMIDGENKNAIEQLSAAISMLLNDPEKMNAYGKLAEERARDFSGEAARIKLEEIFCKLQDR